MYPHGIDHLRQWHPQYYMYRHPKMPSHETILAARDRLLKAHSGLKFDGVHRASLEWDVDKVAEFLNRFPSARMVHLEYQVGIAPQKVRQFLNRYQDRILYGSDEAYGPDDSDAAAVAAIHKAWLEDWRFFVTGDSMHSEDFEAHFHGLQLPRTVLDKIYRKNAEALFPKAWSQRAKADAR